MCFSDGHLSKALVRQRQQARDDRAKAKAETDAYKLLWRAPELIRNSSSPVGGTAKGDIYAFGVIMYEIFGRSGPYGELRDGLTYQEIIRRVCSPEGIELMRPDLEQLEEREEDSDYNVPNCVIGRKGFFFCCCSSSSSCSCCCYTVIVAAAVATAVDHVATGAVPVAVDCCC